MTIDAVTMNALVGVVREALESLRNERPDEARELLEAVVDALARAEAA